MAEKYQRFVDADTEINLEDDDSAFPSISEVNTIYEDGQISPTHNDKVAEDDRESGSITYQKLNNNKEEVVEKVNMPDASDESDNRRKQLAGLRALRQDLRRVLEHLAFRVVTVLLVLLDVIIVIVDLAQNDRSRPIEIFSLVIMVYFMLECSLRLLAQGPREFTRHWIEVLDAVVILISFVFAILPIALEHMAVDIAFMRLIVAGRLIRIILIIRLVSEKRNLEKATRVVVSQNKRRYQKDGFDLDLCYVTKQVIAMSFPSTGLMSIYRNPIKEVARFLDTKHAEHYLVFNLCSERMYDESLFHHHVTRYRVDDHNVPKLQDLIEFGRVAKEWLSSDPENVIAVHCKGGKGRTGTFICTWLVESGAFEEAKESLDFFGDRRTDLSVGSKYQGVETPSQGRYVGYYEKVKREYFGNLPPELTIKLSSFCIKSLSEIGCGDGRDLTCKVITDTTIWMYDLCKQHKCQAAHSIEDESISVTLDDAPSLQGDIKVMFFCSDKSMSRGYDDCLFYFWFHTSFIEDGKLFLQRADLDNPHKKKTWNIFTSEFSITLLFHNVVSALSS